MSSQKGNSSRSRPQKHQNRTCFKNNLHDTSQRTKQINSIQVSDVCIRCKDIIEWKIKYKKYKPLNQPKTCNICGLKTVKQAYHVMCKDCGKKLGVCTKCCENKEVIIPDPLKNEQLKLDKEIQTALQHLPERKRRTVLRCIEKKEKNPENVDEKLKEASAKNERNDLLEKINSLKLNDNDDSSLDDFDDDLESSDEENGNS